MASDHVPTRVLAHMIDWLLAGDIVCTPLVCKTWQQGFTHWLTTTCTSVMVGTWLTSDRSGFINFETDSASAVKQLLWRLHAESKNNKLRSLSLRNCVLDEQVCALLRDWPLLSTLTLVHCKRVNVWPETTDVTCYSCSDTDIQTYPVVEFDEDTTLRLELNTDHHCSVCLLAYESKCDRRSCSKHTPGSSICGSCGLKFGLKIERCVPVPVPVDPTSHRGKQAVVKYPVKCQRATICQSCSPKETCDVCKTVACWSACTRGKCKCCELRICVHCAAKCFICHQHSCPTHTVVASNKLQVAGALRKQGAICTDCASEMNHARSTKQSKQFK